MVLKKLGGAKSFLVMKISRNEKLDYLRPIWNNIIIFVLKMLFVGKKDAIQNFNKGHNKARKIMYETGKKI